jgi:hypothetical protein
MFCSKFTQLSQHYEAALRLVTRVEESLDKTDLADERRCIGLEVEKKAVQERNAAHARMVLHRRNCSICNQKKPNPVPEVRPEKGYMLMVDANYLAADVSVSGSKQMRIVAVMDAGRTTPLVTVQLLLGFVSIVSFFVIDLRSFV